MNLLAKSKLVMPLFAQAELLHDVVESGICEDRLPCISVNLAAACTTSFGTLRTAEAQVANKLDPNGRTACMLA